MAVMQQCPVDMNTNWYHFVTNEPEADGVHPAGPGRFILDHGGITYLLAEDRARNLVPRRAKRARPSLSRGVWQTIGRAMRYAMSWCVAPSVMRRRRGRQRVL